MTMDPGVAEEVAEILLSINGVTFNAAEPYRFTSGLLSPVYVDNRLLLSYPKERRRVVNAWVELIKAVGEYEAVAGTATAGIPHAAWISDQMDLPMVYVRGKAKEHGKKKPNRGRRSQRPQGRDSGRFDQYRQELT